MFAVGLPMAPGQAEAIRADADRVTQALAPWGSGRSYLNFSEDPTDARTAFSAATHARLAAVRSRVDPEGLFRASHPITGS